MAIISVPGLKPPVEKLYALTNVAFEPAAFKAACESFSQFDPTFSDDDLWQFKLAPDLSLEVSLWVEDTGENNEATRRHRQKFRPPTSCVPHSQISTNLPRYNLERNPLRGAVVNIGACEFPFSGV